MDFKSALLSATAVLLVAAPARAADAPADMQKAINSNYQLTCTAVLDPSDKNMDAAAATLSPDFVNVDFKGKETKRDEVIGTMKQQLKTFHGTSCNIGIDSASETDANTIVVVSTMKVEGDIQAPDGKHEISQNAKSQDTWKLSNGQWLQTQSKDLRQVIKVDGNVVQDQGQ